MYIECLFELINLPPHDQTDVAVLLVYHMLGNSPYCWPKLVDHQQTAEIHLRIRMRWYTQVHRADLVPSYYPNLATYAENLDDHHHDVMKTVQSISGRASLLKWLKQSGLPSLL